jgi:stress response protein YsnF
MVSPARQEVYGPGGLIGTLAGAMPADDGEIVIELTEGGGRAVVSGAQITPRAEGGFYLPIRSDELRRAGAAEEVAAGQAVTVPVAREELAVTKQQRESGRVVVHITPSIRREVVDLPTAEDHVDVVRVPVNRVVHAAEPARQEGDVTVIPVYEEVVVVERRLMLKEEVRITRRRTVREQRQAVELRSEEVHISRSKNNS